MFVSLSEGLRGVDGTLVGVQDYLGCLLLIFLACKLLQYFQTMVVRLIAASNRSGLVSKDLIVKSVDKKCPFPILTFVLENSHIRYNDLDWRVCIPVTLYFVGKFHIFLCVFLLPSVLSCFGMDSCFFRSLREFCVSDFRQNQEYHVFNVQDEGLFPLVTSLPEGWDGMRAGTA